LYPAGYQNDIEPAKPQSLFRYFILQKAKSGLGNTSNRFCLFIAA